MPEQTAKEGMKRKEEERSTNQHPLRETNPGILAAPHVLAPSITHPNPGDDHVHTIHPGDWQGGWEGGDRDRETTALN